MPKPAFIDLFAGIGWFHRALSSLGAECVFVSEWDKAASATYAHNYGCEIAGDVTKVPVSEIPDHDVLCAGFPCQPFSIAGKREGFSHATQGTLFFDVLRIATEKKPRILFLENVRNLVSHDKGNTFRTILGALSDAGYRVKHAVLNARDFGIPQNRERIYVVAFRDADDYEAFEFPKPTGKGIPLFSPVSDADWIIRIHEKKADRFYLKEGSSEAVDKIIDGVAEKGKVYQYRRFYVRENKTGVCPTLTANMGTGGHNVPFVRDDFGVRKLTDSECSAIMGYGEGFSFPDNLGLPARYKQCGNSVVVPVVAAIAKNFPIWK